MEIDFSISAMEPDPEPPDPPSDPWLRRRALTLGASEAYAALICLGARDATGVPGWLLAKTKRARLPGGGNAPRLWAEKAGLVRSASVGAPARAGLEREASILAAWPGRSDVADLALARAVPREWLPLIDRRCPDLSATPDAWGRDPLGRLINIEIKATVAPGTPDARPWYATQCAAQMAVTGAAWSLLVTGWQWAASWEPDGPVTAEAYDRDEALIDEIRACAADTMARVRDLSAGISRARSTRP